VDLEASAPSQFLHEATVRAQRAAYDARVSEQTVLVVDDEEAIAEAVRARLESEGYRVVAAADGPEAIERTPSTTPTWSCST
jgi:PleD family two-component response regulator